jgi:hypothetical protein
MASDDKKTDTSPALKNEPSEKKEAATHGFGKQCRECGQLAEIAVHLAG